MDRSATVEMLLLRGQIIRTRDPVIRGELQRQFDEALANLKRKGGAGPPAIKHEPARAQLSHPLYRQDRK